MEGREESLLWLKSRLAGLSEVSSELEIQRQRAALAKLSTDVRALFSSLCQVCQDIPNVEYISAFVLSKKPFPSNQGRIMVP